MRASSLSVTAPRAEASSDGSVDSRISRCRRCGADPELLARARAVVVPSRAFEGAPRVVVEAYAVGVPVLAARSGALPELVLDGESGLLVDSADVQGWKNAVARLSDDNVAERMGAAAYRIRLREFSPEVALKGLEAGYAAAITARDRTGRSRSPGATAATGR